MYASITANDFTQKIRKSRSERDSLRRDSLRMQMEMETEANETEKEARPSRTVSRVETENAFTHRRTLNRTLSKGFHTGPMELLEDVDHSNRVWRSHEMYSHRVDAIAQFAVIATLVFAAAVTECGSYVHADWPVGLARAYLICMFFVLLVSLHCSLLSILVVSSFKRMQSWEAMFSMTHGDDKDEWMQDKKFRLVVRLFCWNADHVYDNWKFKGNAINVQVLKQLADSPFSLLGIGMGLFPMSCLAFISAVAMRMLKDADLFSQRAIPMLILFLGTPATYMSTKLVFLMTQ